MITLFQTEAEERSRIPMILGYALSIACLIWLLHDFHIVRALRDISNVDWKWVVLGMAFDVLSYIVQAIRWKLLLTPFGKVRLSTVIRSVFAGMFANLVFPLRPGEVLRGYLLSNSEGISIGRALGSVGVERLIDLVIATASLAVVSLFVELPRRFRRVADSLSIGTLIFLGIVVLLIFYLEWKMGTTPEPQPGTRRIVGKGMAALSALHAMGTAPSFYSAVLTSILMPICQVLALWSMMRSYNLGLSFMGAVVVLLVINLGVSLPNIPANTGTYQLFCVLGLNVFSVEKTRATGFAFFAWFALTVPFIFIGFAALVRSGLSLHSLRESVIHR
ncbi:MAG TPA: lysylphosphatidylglycerol synthase transmembrane domain-containing protein, partial [Candidatus Acidoferrales bacterium]|nr:lysylphosphatidylglycerol synthase transmembrane domain-containing protein [Candidatus Acidoferrales bacterium]